MDSAMLEMNCPYALAVIIDYFVKSLVVCPFLKQTQLSLLALGSESSTCLPSSVALVNFLSQSSSV